MASTELQWEILKNYTAFTRRQRGIKKKIFTIEPMNLKGVHSLRYSGLVKKKAVDVVPAEDGKGVVFLYKNPKKSKNPRSSIERVSLRRGPRRAFKSIEGVMQGKKYLPAQTTLAVRKASQILRSQRPVSARKTPGRKGKTVE